MRRNNLLDRPARMFMAAAALACGIAGPALAQETPDIQDSPVARVFAGKWMQSKDPGQHGLLMYLTTPRARAGEYFSVVCEAGAPAVKLGFGKRQRGKEIDFDVDGRKAAFALDATGTTKDTQIAKSKIYSYRVVFPSSAARDGFLQSLRAGHKLIVAGQDHPIDLRGAAEALQEQAGYCH
ncbi:hypothetical protein KM176_21340 [Pseudooceanicola sp. CBS1P-1]|uniref:Invasion associated locus B family protein n=1 Tax=Pseudooceanicola albus TaxID=2692189 RepID=A0A6L7GAN1_9RHOB|nr:MULTISPECIES: hypothetical protein [Pseudooceanicola]MBT9386426.1 hypothetical protein [Pseudooceanicola endophyticus]MXN20416.1 hypothetical protein [Pseudooceanicola albus]